MKKTILLTLLFVLLSWQTSAQLLRFKATHESRYRFDPETEAVTSTLSKERPSSKSISFDLDASTLRITGTEHNELFKLNPPERTPKGDLTAVGVESNSAQLVSIVISQGVLAVIYLKRNLLVVYNTKMDQ